MGNNPVSMVDPDGGYINQSSAGQAARAQFLDQLAYDRSMQRGRYSYEFLYGNYKRDLEALYYQHLDNNEISSEFTGNRFLEALLKLNNEYMGMGLAANYLSSGKDYVSQSSPMSDYGHSLQMDLVKMNGEAEAMQNIILPLPPMGVSNGIMDSEGAFDAWSREYRSAWREGKVVKEASEAGMKELVRRGNHNAVGGPQRTIEEGLKQGHGGGDLRSSVTFVMNVIGQAGPGSLISSTLVNGASNVNIDVTKISIYGPDKGDGSTYSINFFDANGNLMPGMGYIETILPGDGEVNLIRSKPMDNGPSFDGRGGTIIINVQLSLYDYKNMNYDQCWNVNFGYTLTTE